jgi:5-methylcytosine-specific restriction protein B
MLTKNELSAKLNQMYYNAPKGEKVSMIHLFGIKYADEIKESGIATKEIAKDANINESYGTEISKGVKLSKYVQVKP